MGLSVFSPEHNEQALLKLDHTKVACVQFVRYSTTPNQLWEVVTFILCEI
jgi:hypothetical protein